MESNSPQGSRNPETIPAPRPVQPTKEPFIRERLTWRTLDLPPNATPRRGVIGFIKFLIAAAH